MEEKIDTKKSSFTIGTAGKGGALKFYFDIEEDTATLEKKFDKMGKVINYFKTKLKYMQQ